MQTLTITNQNELEAALNINEEFTFEFKGLLYYVSHGAEVDYTYDIYRLGTDVETSRDEYLDDMLDGGSYEEGVMGLFEFMTSDTEYLKAL